MNKFSNIENVLNLIYSKAPLQKKKIESFLKTKDEQFMKEFENFLISYENYLKTKNIDIEYVVDSYLKMIQDMFKAQIKFLRTGKYPNQKIEDVIDKVYNNEKEMLSYMMGLALSQYLWSTHFEMFTQLKLLLKKYKNNIKKYIEIGPGHGLFLKSAIEILNEDTKMKAIDISPISLDITKSIINYFSPKTNVTYINNDMLNLDLNSECDFIVMGEVIEHVENPELLLNKICDLLNSEGKAFLSTCVNCPMVDHLYQFNNIDEIRNLYNQCGLEIESEYILPVENLPMDEIIKQKITINYAALVKKVK